MKKYLPWIITGVFALWIASALRPGREKTEFNTKQFGQLPVVLNGRVQPLDSVALNALLSMSGKSRAFKEERKWWEFGKRVEKLPATEWLLKVLMRPEEADEYKVFRTQHPDLQGIIGKPEGGLGYYSFKEIEPKLDKIEGQARPIIDSKKDSQLRTPYEKDVMHLYDSLILYRRLKNSLRPEDVNSARYPRLAQSLGASGAQDFAAEIDLYVKSVRDVRDAYHKSQSGEEVDREPLRIMNEFLDRYDFLSRFAYPLAVPPQDAKEDPRAWTNVGTNLLQTLATGEVHPAVKFYAAMSSGYARSNPSQFNSAVAEYRQWLAGNHLEEALSKGRQEFLFNQWKPFYKSMAVYVVALLLGCAFWLNWTEWMRKSAFYLVALAFVVHTVGLLFRMFLEGRPPVTNLYSSAVFVGWGAVGLGLILERIYREGIGTVTAAAVGFVTLIIAHHLSLSGDTMIMLQAVLDTNFWLATHVVVITAGYASMFVAGLLAIVYLLRGVFTKTLSAPTAKSLARMVYGIVCFSTLFSFVGTILGGIWADQSWGRFWGWDPKENGALMIVLWCAIILHARWGGMIRERGLMAMAIFGNIVTAYSWFGVNMLGIGLHSYGFMDKAFQWLMLFNATQLVLMSLAAIPTRFWKSFQLAGAGSLPEAGNLSKLSPESARS